MLRYCFDTSALNQLHDNPDGRNIASALVKNVSVRITGLNVAECLRTDNPRRRASLLILLRLLADGKQPLDIPNTLQRQCCVCFRDKVPQLRINESKEARAMWDVLQDPGSVDENDISQVWRWIAEIEAPVLDNKNEREEFQRLVKSTKQDRLMSAADFIRIFTDNDDHIY